MLILGKRPRNSEESQPPPPFSLGCNDDAEERCLLSSLTPFEGSNGVGVMIILLKRISEEFCT